MVLVVTATAFHFLGTVQADPDLWWHLRVGLRILGERSIPAFDDWSFTAAGSLWVNHEWLFDVFLGLAWNSGGATGLWILRGALLVLLIGGLVVAYADRVREPLLILICLLPTLPFLEVFITVRAHSFTYLLTVLAVVALDQVRKGRWRWLVVFPPMLVLWVNLHGGFLMGLALVGATLGAFLLGLDGLAARPRGHVAFAIIIAGLGTLFATLINPWGPGLYAYLARELGADHSTVSEWQPVQGAQLYYFALYLLVPLFLWVVARDWRRFVVVLFLLLTAWMTWQHVRFFILMSVFGSLTAAQGLGVLMDRLRDGRSLALLDAVLGNRVAAMTAGLMVVITGLGLANVLQTKPRVQVDTEVYPIHAVAWLGENELGPHVAAPLHWGGYLLWHHPDLKVAIDGRNLTIYDEDWVDQFLRGVAAGTAHRLFDPGDVDVWLLPTDSAQHTALMEDGWHAAWRDPVATVLVNEATQIVEGSPPPAIASFP